MCPTNKNESRGKYVYLCPCNWISMIQCDHPLVYCYSFHFLSCAWDPMDNIDPALLGCCGSIRLPFVDESTSVVSPDFVTFSRLKVWVCWISTSLGRGGWRLFSALTLIIRCRQEAVHNKLQTGLVLLNGLITMISEYTHTSRELESRLSYVWTHVR